MNVSGPTFIERQEHARNDLRENSNQLTLEELFDLFHQVSGGTGICPRKLPTVAKVICIDGSTENMECDWREAWFLDFQHNTARLKINVCIFRLSFH